MSTRIGLISDIHANPAPLAEAISIFKKHKVDLIFCPGDIAGYGDALEETVTLLIENQCKSILGNHEIWHLEKTDNQNTSSYQYINDLPRTIESNIDNKKILMVHAHPPDAYQGGIRLLDQNGEIDNEQKNKWLNELSNYDYDVLIVGHTHQVFAEQIGTMLVINPGSTSYNHSCAILNLPELSVEFYALSNQKIIRSWNWGANQIRMEE